MSQVQTLPGVTPEQEKEAVRVRRIGSYIKAGIDLDHVYTMPGLVEVFEDALIRARRELDIDRMLAEQPAAAPGKQGVIGWLKGLF